MNDYWAEQEYTCVPPDPVTSPDTERLRKLADAATPGPWEVSGSLVGIGRTKPNIGQTWGLRWRQDIEFIAAARTAIPALLDALAAAEHRATRAEARITAAHAILNEDTRWQNEGHLFARVREALDGDA